MIIRCDNCSVSLQLDESKIPGGNFTVRCPRCQNLIRTQKNADGSGGSAGVRQLAENQPAPAVGDNAQQFAAKESEMQINGAMRALLAALQKDTQTAAPQTGGDDEEDAKPRRVLLCLGQHRDEVGKVLSEAGYKVYLAQTPAQANERMREGKVSLILLAPDFAPDFGGAAILQQKINSMPSFERRQIYVASLEDGGTTMNAHEAFLRNYNLIVNNKDIAQLPLILKRALRDFNELYHYYNRAAEFAGV